MRAVILGKVPVAGQVKTRLAPALGHERAAALQVAMAADVLGLCDELGLERTWSLSGDLDHPWVRDLRGRGEHVIPQGGGDLGARIARGLDAVGYPALALGLDAPTLPSHLLRNVLASTADVTLGQAFDGGYWCVALRAPAPTLFEGVRWSCSHTLTDTVARARGLGRSVALAPFWYDVDEPADLVRLQNHLAVLPPERAPHTRNALCP